MRNYSRRQQTQSRQTHKQKQRQRQRQSHRHRGGRWFNKTRSFFRRMYNKARGRKESNIIKTTQDNHGYYENANVLEYVTPPKPPPYLINSKSFRELYTGKKKDTASDEQRKFDIKQDEKHQKTGRYY